MDKKPVAELTDEEVHALAVRIQGRTQNPFAAGNRTEYDEAEEAQILERFAALSQ